MLLRRGALDESFSVLGLENDASSDEVKTAYKKLAMKTHPDRNSDMPDATQRFQAVGTAYSTLMMHFDRTESDIHYTAYNHSDNSEYNEDELYYGDDYYDDDEHLAYFKSLFEEVLREKLNSLRFRHAPMSPQEVPETEEEYQERLRRKRQEQEDARKKRISEDQQRKQRIQEEKERERLAAEERQKQRTAHKKAQAQALKQTAARKLRSQRECVQTLRSAVFAAARLGDADAVKKGIWEDSVDAAGGEAMRGLENFVPQMPKDPAETLLHIAASRGDINLVEWLVNHNAEADELNSAGLTAFHLALQKGHISIIHFFFQKLPPSDDEYRAIYTTPVSTNLLHLAIESLSPELVWMILDNKLVGKSHIREAWTWVCSDDFKSGSEEKYETGKQKEGGEPVEEIMNLLMAYGGFTPPPSPKTKMQGIKQHKYSHKPKPKERKLHPSKPIIDTRAVSSPSPLQNPTPATTPTLSERSCQNSPTPPEGTKSYFDNRSNSRGRGRGHGRRQGRGRGRGVA